MPPAPRAWEPANDVERTLRYAWERDDSALFLRTLAGAPLYLPGFDDRQAVAGAQATQRLLTRQRGGHTYLLVFTSPEALYEGVGEVVEGWRPTTVAELVRAWPDPEWGLVVSPTTPIGAYLDADELAAMAEIVADEPVFHPADLPEALMFRALRASDPASYLDVLVMSTVVLPLSAPASAEDLAQPGFPWRVETVDGLPTVSVFTSEQRLAEALPEPLPTVRVGALALAGAWPDPAWRLSVNPGSAIPSLFAGPQVPDLIRWAHGLDARLRGSPAEQMAAPAPAPALEVVIDPPEVSRYLGAGYDRVSGPVHAAGTARVPQEGYLVRWYHDPATGAAPAAGDLVHDLQVPSGARMYQMLGGSESLLATYQAELRRWVPAVADLLRGLSG